jgi:hypothetical protein
VSEDKRRFSRLEFREPVKYQVRNPAHLQSSRLGSFGGLLSCDLSEGGIRFRIDDFIPLSTELSLEFDVPGNEHVALDGQVAWISQLPHSDQYIFGLRFIDSLENMKSHRVLKEYIQHKVK